MAEESEKRFHAVMDKLFLAPPSPSPNSNSRRTPRSNSASAGGLLRGRTRPHNMTTLLALVDSKSQGSTVEELQSASGGTGHSPMCRPWDREDLLKRLATFKSMTWFAKPEVVSAINCARRGWINVDMDIIACESCGARLFFSTPSSWAQQQVENAASVFSLKLNSGHKLLCPWVDNACDEKLAQFPPTSPADLVDSYKKRCASLLQLLELPLISSTAIDYLRSPLLEYFLKNPARDSGDECEEVLPALYYQAQKLISLCGWEPQLLPYIVDCKHVHDQSIKDGTLPDSSSVSNASITVYSSRPSENEANECPSTESEQYDHTSVVLECRLCGARVGLWAFRTTPRPTEFVRLIGHVELNDKNEAACQTDNTNHSRVESSHAEKEEQRGSIAKSGTTSSNKNLLNLTIAGGPPPAEQNFRPTISLPVVGQNLRTRFSSAFETQEDGHNSPTSNAIADAIGDDNGGCTFVGGDTITKTAVSVTSTLTSPTTADQPENVDGKGKDLNQSSAAKAMEFDPIKQHRHFCPWISSSGKSAPGWKQTLSALERQKEFTYPLTPQASSSLIQVEDPVGSVKKLLTPPSAKRKKLTHGSS